jgi:class 3 adenylate cyclase
MPCPSCGESNRPERLFCGRCGARLPRTCPSCSSPNEPDERFCGRCGVALDGAHAGRPAMPASIAGGRYELRRLLGEGGKKRVYLATDTRLERDVAIALIKTEGLDEAGLARVRREARAMGRLGDHPHIVTVFDVGEEDGRPFIVSQYMAGGSVDDLLQAAAQHRLPVDQTLRIASELCRALQHAHECGVVHRDVKPSNVWLTADGTAKLGDFGLAVARDRSRLTVEGMMVGTVAYMPPEQALGRTPEPRTDLYAFGAMLYEMVTGRPPFLGDDAIAIVSQHLNTTPVAPSWHNGEVPRALETLVLQLLAKSPEDRPASAAAVRTALTSISSRSTIAAPTEQANPLDRLAGGVFVGRESEIEELRRAVDDARAGQGRLVLLAGEPGIGKTRTASELGTYARVRGFQVLWGRSHETGGAPAYWPWVQIIRAYLHDRDAQHVRSEMGTGAADIAQVVSEVRERLPDLPSPPALEPEQARFRLFDSITAFLRNAAGAQPLVLILDDVQWADQPSLLLLQFLAREMGAARLLVICTYRDIELGREHPLFQTLGDLTREPATRRFALRGLTQHDVARYIEMTAGTAPADLIATVHGETEGNPFFVGEVVRLLVTEGRFGPQGQVTGAKLAVPQSVREVIGRRLQRLSTACNHMLGIASAIGREFGLDVLEPLTGSPAEQLREWLDEAIGARIVTKVPEAVGRHRFAHALVRETLYEEVSPAQRIRLHRRIGEVLETLHRARPERHVAEMAYHFAQAAEDGRDVDKAIGYARRAGERALVQLAYEEGARHYQAAVDLLAAHRPNDDATRADLLLGLGAARRRTGEIEKATAAIREAADTARRLGAAESLARAALAYGGQGFVFGQYDAYEVGLLEEALAALGDEDSALHASVAARLAMVLYTSPERERCDPLSRDAVAMARRIGDAAILAYALHSRHAVLQGPRHLDERLAIASEIVRLAEAAGDKEQVARGRHFRIVDLLEQGDMRTAYREMDAQSRLADELRQPLYLWHRSMYRAMRALLEGRLDEGEQLANETLMLGQRASPDAIDTYGVQMFSARRDQGRLDELEASVAATVEQQPHVPGWRVALAHLYAEIGRDDDARREIDVAAAGLTELPEDAVWLSAVSTLSNACASVGDGGHAAPLYDLLLPYAGRAVIVGAGVAFAGAVSHYLGLLAATMERSVEASLHFETALEMHERIGARTWLVQTRFAYARMLRARGEPGDHAKAASLLAQALDTAQALGMKSLVERALAETLKDQGIDASIDAKTSIAAVVSTVQRERPDLRRHAAPDGTVTVLFTDIDGFASMTERLGEKRAHEILRAHGTIVQEQVAAHDGLEVRSEGDGFMVVFSSGRRAILCAIAIQRALTGYSARHPLEPIRVRIGLHTGEVMRESDDFFGTNVIPAARIAARARGGEILVSAVLKELTSSAGDLHFGELRSIDLPSPSNIRQVCEVLWAGAPSPEPARTDDGKHVFRREGEYWTLAYDGTVCRVRDSKGLQHIGLLLRHPGQHFDARELVAESVGSRASADRLGAAQLGADGLSVAGLGDAGTVLDATAKAAYRRRVEELREELEEAERFNDSGRATNAREELDFIAGQLSAAVGLGGRDRKTASTAERARLTATKRIKDALGRIRESHPSLGQYLAAHIKTGYLCAYLPDPDRPIPWTS